jgi:DNA-binding LytR/AlgR family response regulator
MNVLIIEDEPQAAQRLEKLVVELMPSAQIQAKLDSVRSVVRWLESNPMPELIFMDIQLADGLSFSIFEQTEILSPVIFTTAYDEYALQAFKVNSIDYILKPVDKEDLQHALKKFKNLSGGHGSTAIKASVEQVIRHLSKKYKNRFVVKVGEHLKSVEVNDILFFFSLEKATFAQTRDGRKHILDFTLDQVQEMVSPEQFFRINRKYIVALDAMADIIHYTNSRIKLILKTSDDTDVIVARERVSDFKSWLDS